VFHPENVVWDALIYAFSKNVIQVYNIRTAAGRPTFALTSGVASTFIIARNVNTPYGQFPTSDPNLIGTYVTNPNWSSATGGSIVTGNNG
jgi:hypothetical protein